MIATRLDRKVWEVFDYIEDRVGAFTWRATYHGITKREAMARFREDCQELTHEREQEDAVKPYWRRARVTRQNRYILSQPPITEWRHHA